MKKSFVVIMLSLLTMSSCGTYTADGAMTGGMFGAMIGSAVGGISGGWRGSNVGQIVGMAGGAAVGAAIGAAEDKKQEEKIQQYRREQAQRRAARQRAYSYDDSGASGSNDSGFDPTNSGDDRITLDLPDSRPQQSASAKPSTAKPAKVKPAAPVQKPKPAKSKEPVDDVYFL